MAPLQFGTDGIRGAANIELTPELVLAIGRAAARKLPSHTFMVGRDTRRSGPMLQAALSAGLAAEGQDVVDVGVLPTPGVAWLSEQRKCPAAMVSASHNPFADNGIKFFAAGGTKLDPSVEMSIEDEIEKIVVGSGRGPLPPSGYGVGHLRTEPDVACGYVEHLVAALEGRRLDGLKIVVDCANGAAVGVVPAVWEALGVDLVTIACDPDGTNINDGCGSTHPEELAHAVVEHGADLGLALDGDADRLVAVDHTGALATGDELLALFALDMAERGELLGDCVVVTVMTNLGFRLAMKERGIEVRETEVGDRNVLAELDTAGLALGGEQSGHIVFRQRATTGDGVLTGVLLADLVRRSGRSLAELFDGLLARVPQVLVNVPVIDPGRLAGADDVWLAVAEAEKELSGIGRVILRPSGTEPLVRVMVEATSGEQAQLVADRLAVLVAHVLCAGDG